MDGIKSQQGGVSTTPLLFRKEQMHLEYLAHLDKEKNISQLLNKHLKAVAFLSKTSIPPTLEFDDICNLTIKKISYWMGYFHDLGKYSDYFQEYLKEEKDSELKIHAHISACFTYLFITALDLDIDNTSKTILPFLAYLCVRQHHTSLNLKDIFSRRYDIWSRQKLLGEHLRAKATEILMDMAIDKELNEEKFCDFLQVKLLEEDKKGLQRLPIRFENGRISHPKWFFILIYLFSLLIDMDKLDSAYIAPQKVCAVSPDNVVRYLEEKNNKSDNQKHKADLKERRERARNTMLGVIENLNDEEIKSNRIFTLTAPTGIGKTLSSLQCALKLQERIASVEKYIPRIITAIPFINIIEQAKKEYENVFGKNIKMAVHHRLSDFSLAVSNARDDAKSELIPIDKALMETEAWEGDVILTTFVQLFHSIFTGQNRLLKKTNKLAGSIVILDEAQAIPEGYMPLIGAVLQIISKYYGTRFILMTATQPKLLEFGDKLLSREGVQLTNCNVKSLLPDYVDYFNSLKRTKFIPLLKEKITTSQFINLFFQKWDKDKSVLIVVNTIKRSIDIYKTIAEEIKKKNLNNPIYYLSTNITPLDRRRVIEQVGKLLKNKQPVILVSTQTIEAGVDLDFDMAFRDFAPLDSLIQTAGRVNREGGKGEFLPVYIIRLENDNHYIYNLTHRQSTVDLLMEKDEILETEYEKLSSKYYSLALNRGISDESLDIWKKGIMKLNFEELQKFELIKETSQIYDVFVEKDALATDLADAYSELLNYTDEFNYDLTKVLHPDIVKQFDQKLDIFQRKALLKLISAKMNDYIVQVRESRLKGNLPIDFSALRNADTNLLWIPPSQLEQYYEEDGTGFKDESGTAFLL